MTPDVGSNANQSILHLVKPGWRVCEIGVRSGQSSYFFLKQGAFLYMVDPWKAYPEYPESGGYRFDFDKRDALANVAEFPGKYEVIEKMSFEAAAEIPGNLDMVYIDGNHTYDYVLGDIRLYWPKVKSGGWLCGDDYSMWEVMKAIGDAWIEIRKTYPGCENIELKLFGRNWAFQRPL